MYAPAFREIVEYWPASLGINPQNYGKGIFGVKATSVAEVDVTICDALQIEGAQRKAVGSWGGLDIDKSSSGVVVDANVSATCQAIEGVYSSRSC